MLEKEAAMRVLAATALATGIMLAASPAQAQTYDPNFPICLQTFGRVGNHIDCSYATMPQCQLSAWGIAAQCIINPFYAQGSTGKLVGRRNRRN
jgi:hypothetical protein